jgi:hypothetical protein
MLEEPNNQTLKKLAEDNERRYQEYLAHNQTAVGKLEEVKRLMQPDDKTAPYTPNQLLAIKKRTQDIDQTLQSSNGNLDQRVVDRLTQEKTALNETFLTGFSALSPAFQQRITDITRDPTLGEQAKNFIGRVGEGAGSGLVDMAEFVVRNTAGLAMDDASNAKVAEFAQAMRDEGKSWMLGGVPQEVAEKLGESFVGVLGQGAGSTASFLIPTVGGIKLAQVMGATPKFLKVLGSALPALAGGAQSGNSMMLEAQNRFAQMMQNGEVTQAEATKGIRQAELIGALLVGPTEGLSPAGRWAKRMAGIPAGQNLLRQMAQKMGDGGVKTLVQWLRG